MTALQDCSWSYLYWERPARDGDHRAAVEVAGELVAVHCGTHENQLQIRSPHDDIFQDGQQEVGLDTALMDLKRWRSGVKVQVSKFIYIAPL